MSSLCFWFVFFTLDAVYKVKAVCIMVLARTTQIMATYLYQFTPNYKINIYKMIKGVIGIPTVHRDGIGFDGHLNTFISNRISFGHIFLNLSQVWHTHVNFSLACVWVDAHYDNIII